MVIDGQLLHVKSREGNKKFYVEPIIALKIDFIHGSEEVYGMLMNLSKFSGKNNLNNSSQLLFLKLYKSHKNLEHLQILTKRRYLTLAKVFK